MKKTVLLFLSLSLISCGGILKGCFHASDSLLDDIGKALKNSPSSYEGDTEIARSIKSYDFDISRSRQIIESPEFKQAYETSVSQCDRLGWRQEVKGHLKSLERESDSIEYIQGQLKNKIKKIFNKGLLRIGPLKTELETLDSKISLSIDTPCGTEQYAKPLNDMLDSEFKKIILEPVQIDNLQTKLLYGTWRDVLRKSTDVIDVVSIGKTKYKKNGTYESTGEINIIYKKENALIFTSSFKAKGKWVIRGNKMYDTTTSIILLNKQDPAELFANIEQSLKDAEGDTDVYEILFLTSKVVITKYDFDGLEGTNKSIKIN